MTVRPTQSGQTPRPAVERTGKTAVPNPAARPASETSIPAGPSGQRDDVQISAQARELQQMDTAPRGSASEIPADRLKEVLSRVSSGFYEQPEVRDTVLRRLEQDL